MKPIPGCLCLCLLLLSSCGSFYNPPASHPSEYTAPPVVAATSAAPEPVAPPTPKKRVLVLKFLNHTAYPGDDLGQAAYQDMKSTVGKEPDLIAVGEEEIEGHEDFSADENYYNYKVIFDKARRQGIAAVILGEVQELSFEDKGEEIGLFRARQHRINATVKFQLVDVASERDLVSRLVTGTTVEEDTRFLGRATDSEDASHGRGAVSRALDPVSSSFSSYAKKIAWVGRIAKIDFRRYYINAGEQSGITKGQLLKVFGDGTSIIDQQTGTFLGLAPGRFKGLLKVIDYMGNDAAVAIIHSGGGFTERDRVELFSPSRER